jgi:hypothetical protein
VSRSLPAALGAVALLACGRVPEQQLRDEQARSRRYRDAYEGALQESASLKKRLAEAQQRAASCQATSADAQPAPAGTP